MVTTDISSLPVVTSSDPASSSPAKLPGAPTSTADDGHHCPPIPTPSATSTVVIDQSDADKEIGTPISPAARSANQPNAMEVDAHTESPPSTPVDEASQPVQATPQPGAATSTLVHAATEPSPRPPQNRSTYQLQRFPWSWKRIKHSFEPHPPIFSNPLHGITTMRS
uniref:AlNc14C1112G12782 protein n=1 Tax=Albugo laibachii Nc14 TaxID=890382 RepID=F0X2I9_9STRA|nr:AlNc14C1112G12782 [Albugo laibachii Nc14]|eukprot:CCA28092.1 AlNc14C1112G12782 [Albugo laibachii Nc14]